MNIVIPEETINEIVIETIRDSIKEVVQEYFYKNNPFDEDKPLERELTKQAQHIISSVINTEAWRGRIDEIIEANLEDTITSILYENSMRELIIKRIKSI